MISATSALRDCQWYEVALPRLMGSVRDLDKYRKVFVKGGRVGSSMKLFIVLTVLLSAPFNPCDVLRAPPLAIISPNP